MKLENAVDILLVNSLAPRQRSIYDTALENSLVLLRTCLAEKGHQAMIYDYQRLNLLEQGIPQTIITILHNLAGKQLRFFT